LKKKGSGEKQKRANRRWKKNNPDKVRDARLQRLYGTTQEKVDAELALQGGCGVCRIPIPTGKGWDIDHNHETKEKRGILCHKCNLLLGLCDESIQILENAITYLRKYANRIEIVADK